MTSKARVFHYCAYVVRKLTTSDDQVVTKHSEISVIL